MNGTMIASRYHFHLLLLLLGWPFMQTLAAVLDDEPPEPHPDLNDHEHEGMVFIGRLCEKTGRRLSADHDNTIRYVFGTSFVEERNDTTHELDAAHWSTVVDTAVLVHHATGDVPGSSGHDPHDHHKTREQVLKERQEQHARDVARGRASKPQGPVPFGHVDTHDLDGGVVPVVAVAVEPFWMDATPVTNAEFAQFVAATYYETEAELYSWSFVLSSFLPADAADYMEWETDPDAPHWVAVYNATWRHPEGPRSSYKWRADHPVVHVSHRDAAEYCTWRNKRLPGEREYEAVARASHWSSSTRRTTTTVDDEHAIHGRTMYAWGHAIPDVNEAWTVASHHANLWGAAGPFPTVNDAVDGWRGTSPVRTYPPNAAGVYDTTGNVWEWMRGGKNKARIVRGASYVDSIDGSTNHAATLGARAVVHGTTTAGNIGFRCAKAVPKRVEHHWTWHDEEVHGQLAVEDEFGNQQMLTNDDEIGDEDEFEAEAAVPRKKKKVVLKPERISNEL